MKLNLFLPIALFAFASTVSSTITLSRNFSPFPTLPPNSPKPPPLCTSLYASPISQCSPATDFLNDAYCTPLCVRGLEDMEEKLNEACDGILAPKDSVLGRIFEGRLVESLCKDGGASGPGSEVKTSIVGTPTSTTTVKSTVSIASTTKEDKTSTTATTVETSTGTTLPISTTTFTASSTTDDTSSQAPTETRSYRERMRDEQVNAIAAGGGGSPYDNIYAPRVRGGGGGSSESCNSVLAVVFVAMAVGLLGGGA